MSRALVISVRLHDGRYHGSPDWPPSPARLFQALLAGVAGALSNSDRTALGWLESLDPPVIGAPSIRMGQGFTTFVPNNDLDAVGGDPLRVGEVRAGKRIKPYLFDAESRFLYVWNIRGSEDDEPHAQTVCVMAERLYQFGRGVDMAWAWGEILDETEANMRLNDHQGATYRPCMSGSELALACPQTGSLQSLLDRYSAQRQRFTTLVEGKKVQQLFSQPPKPRFEQISYNSPATLRLYDLAGSLVPWSLAKCSKLVECVRDAATERLTKTLPDRKDEIERVLIGRDATEADKATRIRISPLPSIGHPHADRAIRRLLVQIPPNCPIRTDDIAWAFSGLALKVDTETGEILLALVPAADLGMLRYYGVDGEHASRIWRTVTPAALPERAARRRIEPSRRREEAKGGPEREAEQNRATTAVLQALRHAQFDTRVSTVRTQREPFDAKGTRAEVFAAGTRFAKERLWHIEIGFTEPLAGPLVLGDGRYMGLGLMAPAHRVEGVYCFTILDGLANRVDVTALTQSLRRAVMSRVQDTIGRKALPEFFCGHEINGAPSRSGIHAHLAFAIDLVRNRLLIVAPHALEGRQPTHAERQHLKDLDLSLTGFRELLAGAAGRLKLAQSSIQIHEDPLFVAAQKWESVTEYQPTRYAKRTTQHEALVSDARTEILRRGIAAPTHIEVIELREGPQGGLAGRLRLHFATAVSGLILIGRTRHLGGGLFSAIE